MNEMYCTQCGHDPLLQADNDRRNNFAIEKLQTAVEIERAQLAAMQAERDILSDELNSERECSTALGGYLDQAHKDVEQISEELSAARARIAELEAALKGLNIAIANDMRHADDVSGTGWDTLKELSDAMSNASRLTQPLPAGPEVDNG